jgi:hypothetical protein
LQAIPRRAWQNWDSCLIALVSSINQKRNEAKVKKGIRFQLIGICNMSIYEISMPAYNDY